MNNIEWAEEPAKSKKVQKTHEDFQRNKQYCKTFIDRISSRLINGMILTLGGSTITEESLLWVKYSPPKGIPFGDFAQCINLNDSHATVKASLDSCVRAYDKMAKNVAEKYGDKKPKANEVR